MYGRCRSVGEARSVFRGIKRRNVFSWNIMLAAYAHNGHYDLARAVFEEMPERDTVSWNEMLGAYAKGGLLREARECFDRIPAPDVVSWTLMVSAYAMAGHFLEAILMFRRMDLEGVHPDRVMYVIILDACASVLALDLGRIIHSCLLDGHEHDFGMNLVVRTALVNLYGKCGAVEDAQSVFDSYFLSKQGDQSDKEQGITLWNAMMAAYAQNGQIARAVDLFGKMPARDVISWNTMVAALAQNEMEKAAMETFSLMDLEGVQPNEITFIAAIDACSKLGSLAIAELVHSSVRFCGFQSDVRIGNALLNMYGKCGCVEVAREVFRNMPEKNVVSWSALISAYSQNHRCKEALASYRQMIHEGVKPNEVTLLGAIDACAGSAVAADAEAIHTNVRDYSSLINVELATNPVIGNAIINMHGKCGNLAAAMAAFAKLGSRRNVISWNTIIGAYAHSGNTQGAIELFRAMAVDGAVPPNEGCFTSVLSSCNHAGLLGDACDYFAMMVADFGIAPVTEHFHCMIDVLGRAGRLAEVAELIKSMPCKADVIAWTAFVDACKTHGEFGKAGEVVLEKGFVPSNSGPYALLSNMYAA
ncbi:pentatricopeptide repeat-containing protein At2g22070-like [Selaginella moellendorffii]|uniref:pentatricopeptide repeat-containing protein At2g22070-like n=1 Tax=Selaginella moellendorffii TaxID=88036 RepID=UPI000D1CAF8C|nr:pentatricopeptide repeat-containing protein At2g22070-like [Selaginella moellendorffii]|eukprot:XP_024522585.1 pentatricopeptide repeat-containing protein At2g22070-like [Selaginella moellendorffii]